MTASARLMAAESATKGTAPITTVAGAFARWPEITTDDEAVTIEGVVTGVMPSGNFRMHDGELGIYVTKPPDGRKLVAGDRVAVVGVLRKGGYSPWITPKALTMLGRGELPDARPVNYQVLASGAADNQWVEIEGVIRAVHVPEPRDFVILDFGMPGGSLRVLVNYEPHVNFEPLIDAAVRLRGVAAVNTNTYKHVVEPSFRVPSFAQVTVLRPGQPDAFELPLLPVQRLMRFSLGATHQHRVRTGGVVTRSFSDTMLFVRNGDAGLQVVTQEPHGLRTGDRIDAVGFPDMAEGMAVLQHALCRVTGREAPPVPARPTIGTLLEGTYNSDLVTVAARLVDWVITGRNVTLIFQSGDHLFKGLLNLPANASVTLPEKNSLVNVTGISVISELEDLWFYRPTSFVLLVADLADLQVLQAAPWWTPERLWRALAMSCLVLLASVGWVWALRRQIDGKRALIEQQARHAAALEERSRIARELHDTLEQGLTGLSLQMKAMETDLDTTPHVARSRLQAARQMLRQSRALARNAIRELREETVPSRLEGLVEGFRRITDSWNKSGALAIDLQVRGPIRSLAPRIENHLLGIGTEAITNAVKHGRADSIQVQVDFEATSIRIAIKDNGAGFEPSQYLERASGCFGLLGMRERSSEIRGRMTIQSQPGQGTEVVVIAPIDPVAVGRSAHDLALPGKPAAPASVAP